MGIQTFTFTPDPNQCALTTQIDIEVYEIPQISSINELNLAQCSGDSALIEVNASGNGFIEFQVESSPYTASNQFWLPEGSFNFTVIDDNSCVSEQTYTISAPDEISVLGMIENVFCTDGFGSIDIDFKFKKRGYKKEYEK